MKKYKHFIVKKFLKKWKIKHLIRFYFKLLLQNTSLIVVQTTSSFFFNSFFCLTFPKKQLHYQLYLATFDFHKAISSGFLLKWNFNKFKFFKKTPKNITSIVLLFWYYFFEFFQELDVLFIKTYNLFIFNFLNIFYNIFELPSTSLIVKKSYNNIFYKKRRIKKRVYKLLMSY